MARIRTIKPEFFTSDDIVSLSPLARLLYIALWCEADKEGRMVWKPATFKLRYLPGDACDVHALCNEIIERGLIVLYGDGFAHIPAFSAHQHINPRETTSQLPEPNTKATRQPRVGTRQPRVGTREALVSAIANQDLPAQVGREGKGREGKGKEGDKTARVARPPDGVPDLVWQDFLKIRKAKRLPMTETAWQGVCREAEKAGLDLAQAVQACCEYGWATFDAGWYAERTSKKTGRTTPLAVQSFRERDDQATRKRWEQMTGETHPENQATPQTIDAPLATLKLLKAVQ